MGNDMKITINGFKVYDSGSVITHENNSVLFEIKTIRVLISFRRCQGTGQWHLLKLT